MLLRKVYIQLIGFLTLSAFLLSSSNPLFYASEVFEEEEERIEVEDAESDRFLTDQSGNNGFNIVPDLNSPCILQAEQVLISNYIGLRQHVENNTVNGSLSNIEKLFILFHNLKLDFC